MIEVKIPGGEPWQLAHLVLDLNGTLACDGVLLSGIAKRIAALKSQLTIHLLTADTHGSAQQAAQKAQELAKKASELANKQGELAKQAAKDRLGPDIVGGDISPLPAPHRSESTCPPPATDIVPTSHRSSPTRPRASPTALTTRPAPHSRGCPLR